jgi:hypothetical protein
MVCGLTQDQLEARYHGKLSKLGLNVRTGMMRACPSVPFDVCRLFGRAFAYTVWPCLPTANGSALATLIRYLRYYSGARKAVGVCPSRVRMDNILWCCGHYHMDLLSARCHDSTTKAPF